MEQLVPDYSQARKFVDTMYPYEQLTFQTASKQTGLIKPSYRHGTLDQHWDWLVEQNLLGANVYIMVNKGDCKGRRFHNVTEMTSALIDLDGAPLDPVLSLDMKPHIIIETSLGRFQGRWILIPVPITPANRIECKQRYERLQVGIAQLFDADPSVKSLSQVSRLPGFINHNHDKFIVRIVEINFYPGVSDYVLADNLTIDLKKPYVIPSLRSTGNCEVSVDLLSDDPIQEKVRNISLFTICGRLARQEVLGDNLARVALQINTARCTPPLPDEEVIGIANKATKFYVETTDKIIKALKDYNPNMSTKNGHFYRYDRETKQYRVISLVALRNKIYKESRKTATDSWIRRILKALSDELPALESINNPERQFIEECLVPGENSILREINDLYQSWCRDREIKPVKQDRLRKEIDSIYPGMYRRNIRTGKSFHHGFLGLSIRPSMITNDDCSSIFDW